MPSTLEARLRRLEENSGGDGEGCERCRGTLVIVEDAISGVFHSASWNGEALSEGELRSREREAECPKCGRRIDPDETVEITIGGDPELDGSTHPL